MDNIEVKQRLKEEIIQSTNEEVYSYYDKSVVDAVRDTIVEQISNAKFGKNFYIDRFDITSGENKENERMFYVKGSLYRHNASEAHYFAYNSNSEFIGQIRITVLNDIPPTTVEMEYKTASEYRNKGNITVLARDGIIDVFEEKLYDGKRVKEGAPQSCIDSIFVNINSDNCASLAVAKKLGFDEKGYLYIEDYEKQIGKKSSTK